MSEDLLQLYFPHLSPLQKEQFQRLLPLYLQWNEQINVISRKDMDNFYERHVLHALSIAKAFPFKAGDKILDIGTGGGFPGIPLAIYFPESQFVLVDSIAKKIHVVQEIIKALDLQNASALSARAELVEGRFDYIVSRAVAPMSDLLRWSKNKHAKAIIALKGGDLKAELGPIKKQVRIIPVSDYFKEPFFETKKIVRMSL